MEKERILEWIVFLFEFYRITRGNLERILVRINDLNE
jgi:hypothetical protein